MYYFQTNFFVQKAILGNAVTPDSWIATAEVTLQIHLEHNGFNIYANEVHMGFVSFCNHRP